MISHFFQFLGDGALQLASFIVGLLPSAPDFTASLARFLDNGLLRYSFDVLNWFVPVGGLVSLVGAWAVACLVFMAVRLALSLSSHKG